MAEVKTKLKIIFNTDDWIPGSNRAEGIYEGFLFLLCNDDKDMMEKLQMLNELGDEYGTIKTVEVIYGNADVQV